MEELPVFVHPARLQFESKSDKPDPVYACTSCRGLLGGAYVR
jgi:Mn-containing catalase